MVLVGIGIAYWVLLFLISFVLVSVAGNFPTQKALLRWPIDFAQSLIKGSRGGAIPIQCQMVEIMHLIFSVRKHFSANIFIFHKVSRSIVAGRANGIFYCFLTNLHHADDDIWSKLVENEYLRPKVLP